MKNTFITNYQRMVRRKTFIDTTDNLHYINTADNSTDNQAYSTFALEDITQAIESLDGAYKTPLYDALSRIQVPRNRRQTGNSHRYCQKTASTSPVRT